MGDVDPRDLDFAFLRTLPYGWPMELHRRLGRLLFAGITAVVLFPGVYKKVVTSTAPLLVLLAPCFIAGLGYEALLNTALKVGGMK